MKRQNGVAVVAAALDFCVETLRKPAYRWWINAMGLRIVLVGRTRHLSFAKLQ